MTSSQKTAEIKRLAYECAERKYSGCNDDCNNCPLNVAIYFDDPREAVLIQANAELDYQKNIQYQNEQIQRMNELEHENTIKNITPLIILGIVVLVIIICCGGC
jgi:hypothetical protein